MRPGKDHAVRYTQRFAFGSDLIHQASAPHAEQNRVAAFFLNSGKLLNELTVVFLIFKPAYMPDDIFVFNAVKLSDFAALRRIVFEAVNMEAVADNAAFWAVQAAFPEHELVCIL